MLRKLKFKNKVKKQKQKYYRKMSKICYAMLNK